MKRRKVTPEKVARAARQHALLCPDADDIEYPCDRVRDTKGHDERGFVRVPPR